jgi:ABC-type nickel/cobalt efflux system permease component RcnA
MPPIDGWLEGFLHGTNLSLGVVLLISLLLGLRHASDPDHLAAVSTLIASEEHEGVRKATFMGFSWGLGHATTLILVGMPLVLLGQYLPEGIQQSAEVAIGIIIVVLAVRLLVRWHRGVFHAHAHAHEGGETHRHLHSSTASAAPVDSRCSSSRPYQIRRKRPGLCSSSPQAQPCRSPCSRPL